MILTVAAAGGKLNFYSSMAISGIQLISPLCVLQECKRRVSTTKSATKQLIPNKYMATLCVIKNAFSVAKNHHWD